MPLRHSWAIVAPQLGNCCATVVGLLRHGLYIGDIGVMGYFYDSPEAKLRGTVAKWMMSIPMPHFRCLPHYVV